MIEGREFPKRFQSRVRFSSVPSDIARIVGNSKNVPMLTLMYSLQTFLQSNRTERPQSLQDVCHAGYELACCVNTFAITYIRRKNMQDIISSIEQVVQPISATKRDLLY